MKLKVFICDGFVSAAKEYRDEGVEFYCTKVFTRPAKKPHYHKN